MFARTVAPIIPVLGVVVALVLLAGWGTPAVDRLTGVTWQWTGTAPSGAPGASPVSNPPDPAAYTIIFESDRTFLAQADCNTVAGTYRTIPPGRVGPLTGLLITPGPSTLVACGPGSFSDAFVEDLARAATYAVADGVLTITLAGGALMTFR